MSDTLLTTKLFVPQTPPELVPRPHLAERLSEGLARKLILVSAPAGFGKSTLVTGWLAETGHTPAWLSLDQGDNDPIRFWTYLIAAVQTVGHEVGDEARHIISSPQLRSAEPAVISLINDISQLPHPLILVLDDYHVIEAGRIHDRLSYLLDNQPPNLHLVLITRVDPPLSLARLRAHGQLIEIRAVDLQFSSDEAAMLFNKVMDLHLKPEQVAALNLHTEGWIVGLQLAALSLRGHPSYETFIERFTGSHQFVPDYLTEEVLRALPEPYRQFLLRTSILERFCGALCRAVTGNPASLLVLDEIRKANLFVIPLGRITSADTGGHWFRYHHLFAEVLRALLERDHPDEIRAIHQRAAVWFENEGYAGEAVDHALRSGDMQRAKELILKHWGSILHRGEVVNGRYYDAGTSVILQGGKIVSMPGLTGEPTAVKPDFTIDLQGKTVLPGLFNTHCHLLQFEPTFALGLSDMRRLKRCKEQQQDKNMAECLAHGITHVRDAWHPDLNENRALRERISKGELPGPRILQAVVVGPTGSYMQEKLSLVTKVLGFAQVDPSKDYAGAVAFPIDATEQQVRDAVDIAIDEHGADVIKIGDESFSPFSGKPVPMMTIQQLSAVADQARRRGVQSTMHHMTVESFRRGIEAGVSSLAHVPTDAPLTPGDVEALKASGCFIDPTISVWYTFWSWKLAGARSNDHPELNRLTAFRDRTYTFATIADEYFIPELRPSVMNGYKRCASGKPKMMGIIDASGMFAWSEKTAMAFENFCVLAEHGVPMTTGNDNKPPCTPAMMGLELLMFDHVLKGMPDRVPFSGADAVKIATINSARSLGLEKEFGSIESGKTADLVILDGDPLEDFRVIGSRVAALFMDGKLVINNCGLEVESNGKAQG